jgi:class 3 adenylate cyclase
VVGYSRLVGDDEAGTIARLKALRKELIEPLIADYRGRLVKLMGDGALVEFASAPLHSNRRFIELRRKIGVEPE